MRWIIGDIHGMLRPLETLIAAVRQRDTSPRFFFCGDYVNRGPDSRGVIDLLMTLPAAHFVRGNHDDMFDLVVNETSYAHNPHRPDPVAAYSDMYDHGMGDTFLSYGVTYAELKRVARWCSRRALRELTRAVPAAHRAWLTALPPVVAEEDLFVAHGYWPPNLPNDMADPALLLTDPPMRNGLIWGRFSEAEILAAKPWVRHGYFGHTPTSNYAPDLRGNDRLPVRGPRITLVDTGAFHRPAGRLTALCHETGLTLQATSTGELR